MHTCEQITEWGIVLCVSPPLHYNNECSKIPQSFNTFSFLPLWGSMQGAHCLAHHYVSVVLQ